MEIRFYRGLMEHYNPDLNHRHSIRFKGYDYSKTGAYFLTICTKDRECLFGEIVDGKIKLNEYGQVVIDEWLRTGDVRKNVGLDAFGVMPNHFHGIVVLTDDGRGTARRAPTLEQFGKPVGGSLPTIIRSFKSAVTKNINQIHNTPGLPLWQRNYYEHIVRSEEELNRFREYIQNNPMQWEMDEENPERNTVKTASGILPSQPSLAKQLLKEREGQFK